MKPLNIHIVVGGRFHSEKMAHALLEKGHRVTITTSLPKVRFEPSLRPLIDSYPVAEAMYRGLSLLGASDSGDHLKMKQLGRHAALAVEKSRPDLIISWSSFGKEVFERFPNAKKWVMRDSTHIEFQNRLLTEEAKRLEMKFKVRDFCTDRELREYELSDHILVLSEFAKESFIHEGIHPEKLSVLPLGVDTGRFSPIDVYRPKKPLKVVFFGSVGLRKGTTYFLEAVEKFSSAALEAHVIGPVELGFRSVLVGFDRVKVHAPMSQKRLAEKIRTMDLFCFPTIEDGFGQTLIQAMAAGLVPITTPHCGASQVIEPLKNGMLVEPGQTKPIVEVLMHLLENPSLLQSMRKAAVKTAREQTWERYAKRLNAIIEAKLPLSEGMTSAA